MILYGTRTLTSGQKVLSGVPCSKCGGDAAVLTNLYSSGHIFFIPFLWAFKKTLAFCPECKRRMTLARLNKKYNLGLTKDDMKSIEVELDADMKPEDKKTLKRRNTIGIITFSLIILFFLLALLS